MPRNYPTEQNLIEAYNRLFAQQPHHMLPLETSLPKELGRASRNKFRIILTMILSQRIDDKRLSRKLSLLFNNYNCFSSLRTLYMQQRIPNILGCIDGSWCNWYNSDRLERLLYLYFNSWHQRITERNINKLENGLGSGYGYGKKFVKCIQAYCFGNNRVLPLDGPAFDALQNSLGFYRTFKKNAPDMNKARLDIESKVVNSSISLIDFHEMLRWRGQAGRIVRNGLTSKQINIIIGWNAWRILCSNYRRRITSSQWIRNNLAGC